MSAPSLIDLKVYVNVSDSAHDGVLQEVLDAAIARVEREAGIVAAVGSQQTFYSGGPHGTAALWFTAQPVTVSQVEIREPSVIGGTGWTVLDADEWEQLGARLQRTEGRRFPAGYSNIRVTYGAGFDGSTPMPDDLRLAILKVAAAEFRGRKTATPTTSGRDGQGRSDADIAEALSVARSYRPVMGF